jgi:tRNA-specific 2-thiouridylase
MKDKRVLIAMSGGVDSSVAAAILKEAGYEVIGATMKIWPKKLCGQEKEKSCCSLKDIEDARKVCKNLNIRHYVLNLESDFQKNVIDYFIKEYLSGSTPNPCIVCNEKVKFGTLLKKAQNLGCDFIATGHYARIERNKNCRLREASDKTKDQSYVLFSLSQQQIKKILLPLGSLTKDSVRAKAKQIGLHISEKPDSQEICFVPDNDYAEFIKKYCNLEDKKGKVLNSSGTLLGYHQGFWNFTIGQRRGLGIAARNPLYVVEISAKENVIVAGEANDVKKKKFLVKCVNWMTEDIKKETEFKVKIRYNHKKASASVKDLGGGSAEVDFKEPQNAITPGQAAVFYDGEYVAGGGWIKAVYS